MSTLSHLYIWLVKDRWSLGFIEEPLSDIVYGRTYDIHYVTGIPRYKWYADPFILDCDDKQIELLVEEWSYSKNIGRIAKLTIDRHSYRIIDESIVLELDTHLSFPFIQRKDDVIYVSPENAFSGVWNQFEFNRKTNKLENKRVIISEPLTDAISTSLFGEELIFSTHLPTANKSVLSIYNSQGMLLNSIHFSSNIARGAGDWFMLDGKVYRPAQDCNGGYGKAVIIQEVKRMGGYNFEFKDVCRVESNNAKFNRGLHTLNHYKGLTVVDVNGYKRKFLGRLTDILKSFFSCRKNRQILKKN